jgi:hypothetical protein
MISGNIRLKYGRAAIGGRIGSRLHANPAPAVISLAGCGRPVDRAAEQVIPT